MHCVNITNGTQYIARRWADGGRSDVVCTIREQEDEVVIPRNQLQPVEDQNNDGDFTNDGDDLDAWLDAQPG